jgi:hypothetical protein
VQAPPAPSGAREPSLPDTQGPFLASSSCSADALHDNWGANWFLDHYCNEGGIRKCWTNKGEAWAGPFSAWARWNQMEGDFNVAGHATAQITRCNLIWCQPRALLYDQDLFPRRILSWTFTDGRDRFDTDGTSPCGHLHVAYLR